jgi:DNA processing protein
LHVVCFFYFVTLKIMSNTSTALTLLHLSLIDGVGPAAVQRLLQVNSALDDLYGVQAQYLMHAYGFSQAMADKLVAGLGTMTRLENELSLIQRHNISWMTIVDPAYPALLKEIHVPPTVLYWQGSPLSEGKKIAVIGSRQANNYGQACIDVMVPELVQHDWTIVSGGALGADTMAHKATLAAGGTTIVVLGSGLLRPFPSENKQLFKDVVAASGTVLSPFPLTMYGAAGNFPARNRIISGLSRGCVVVQAAARSGTSITAHCALEQGRDVFAVPGPIDDPLSAGCHALIQEGAKLVTSSTDILLEYGEVVIQDKKASASQEARAQQLTLLNDVTPRGLLIRACAQPTSIDELLEATSLSLPELQTELFQLQLDGRIKQTFTGKWEAI